MCAWSFTLQLWHIGLVSFILAVIMGILWDMKNEFLGVKKKFFIGIMIWVFLFIGLGITVAHSIHYADTQRVAYFNERVPEDWRDIYNKMSEQRYFGVRVLILEDFLKEHDELSALPQEGVGVFADLVNGSGCEGQLINLLWPYTAKMKAIKYDK